MASPTSETRRAPTRGRSLLTLLPHQSAPLSIPVALLLGLALVAERLAARQAELDLRATLVVEVQLQRHDGQPFPLHGSDELVDLSLVQEELSGPLSLVVEAVGLEVFGDI